MLEIVNVSKPCGALAFAQRRRIRCVPETPDVYSYLIGPGYPVQVVSVMRT